LLPLCIEGWVKRDIGAIHIGVAHLNASQKFEIAIKSANPTIFPSDLYQNLCDIYP
jgi:hypothetical protein